MDSMKHKIGDKNTRNVSHKNHNYHKSSVKLTIYYYKSINNI